MGAGRAAAGAAIGSAIAPGLGTIIGAGIGGLSNLIGQGMTRRAAREYNKGQMEIAQMNNEWNAAEAAKNRAWQEGMVDSQNQWNLEQWNRENEYNSPAAQRERLEAAGLNPYMMLDGGNAGSASSLSSASPSGGSQAAPAQMPNQQALRYDFSSVADAINSFFVNQKTAQDTRNAVLDYSFNSNPDVMRARLMNMVNFRPEYLEDSYINARRNNAFNLAQNDMNSLFQQTQALETNIALTSAQALETGLSAEYQRKVNEWFDPNQRMNLAVALGNLYSAFTMGNLNMAKLRTEGIQQIRLQAEAAGLRMKNEMYAKLFDSAFDAMEARNNFDADYFKAKRDFVYQSVKNQADKETYETGMKQIDSKYYDEYSRLQREWLDAMITRSSFQNWTDVGDLLMNMPIPGRGPRMPKR